MRGTESFHVNFRADSEYHSSPTLPDRRPRGIMPPFSWCGVGGTPMRISGEEMTARELFCPGSRGRLTDRSFHVTYFSMPWPARL